MPAARMARSSAHSATAQPQSLASSVEDCAGSGGKMRQRSRRMPPVRPLLSSLPLSSLLSSSLLSSSPPSPLLSLYTSETMIAPDKKKIRVLQGSRGSRQRSAAGSGHAAASGHAASPQQQRGEHILGSAQAEQAPSLSSKQTNQRALQSSRPSATRRGRKAGRGATQTRGQRPQRPGRMPPGWVGKREGRAAKVARVAAWIANRLQ